MLACPENAQNKKTVFLFRAVLLGLRLKVLGLTFCVGMGPQARVAGFLFSCCSLAVRFGPMTSRGLPRFALS